MASEPRECGQIAPNSLIEQNILYDCGHQIMLDNVVNILYIIYHERNCKRTRQNNKANKHK